MSAEKVRQLNDAFRTSFSGRNAFVTAGVQALGPDFMAQAIAGVREYKNFTIDDDPHGEHDFGSLKIGQHKLFWKIDYYDTSMTCGSDDPSDPAKTTRVLTIMLAEEY
jgi:hypothetical protein